LLAFNRYVELKSPQIADRLFYGRRLWFWLAIPATYGIVLSSSVDLPPIYNSVWSVYFFQIDLREDAAPVNDWTCFSNSMWVVCSLVTLYSLLLWELRKRHSEASSASGREAKRSRMQRRLLLQSFLICFFLFLVAASYA